ncbi:MAG: glycosyltransferase [Thermoplasmata archaeon]
MPRISVIISAHDRKQYVTKAVDSVLAQDINRSDIEIIVVKNFHDSEVDGYLEKNGVVSIFTDEKFLSRKMVTGSRSSTGDLLFFLDDDDLFAAGKIAAVSGIFITRKDVSMVHDSNTAIDDAGKPVESGAVVSFDQDLYLNRNSPMRDFGKALTYRSDWYISCMSFRRDVFEKFEDELWNVERSVDKFLFYMALARGETVAIIHNRLTYYRIHDSLTTVNLSMRDFFMNKSSFYVKSSETMRKILELSHQPEMNEILSYNVYHADLLARFFTFGKRTGFHDFVQLLRYHRRIGNDASLSWAGLSLISGFSMGLARYIYYRNYRKTYLIN